MATPISMPQGMAYGWWHFPNQFVQDLTFDIEIVAGDERTPGRYYQLYQGQIGGQGMYFGFQTALMRPGIGWQGKGLLFSRWGSRDNKDAEPISGGWKTPVMRATSSGSDHSSTGELAATAAGYPRGGRKRRRRGTSFVSSGCRMAFRRRLVPSGSTTRTASAR